MRDEKEKDADSFINSTHSKKFVSYEQAFFLFYGAIIGLLVGAWGNLWATIFFEYQIKGDTSLSFTFFVSSIIFFVLIVVLIIGTRHFYGKMSE